MIDLSVANEIKEIVEGMDAARLNNLLKYFEGRCEIARGKISEWEDMRDYAQEYVQQIKSRIAEECP